MADPLILASRSPARAEMLRAAGVAIEVAPAAVDEASIKTTMAAERAPARDVADALAELKARRIGGRAPGRLVLGADQVLVCDGVIYDKPVDLAAAETQLRALRGRAHELFAAAVICEGVNPIWRHVGRAQLVMRPFSDDFLADYVAGQGAGLLETVGAYRLEAGGAQLFSRVQGDYFSVLGLPLLELLGFLRARGGSAGSERYGTPAGRGHGLADRSFPLAEASRPLAASIWSRRPLRAARRGSADVCRRICGTAARLGFVA